MKTIVFALLFWIFGPCFASQQVTETPGPFDLYKGTSKVSSFATYAACLTDAKARALLPGAYTFSCKNAIKINITVVADPPAPVVITTQPVSATVVESSAVTLSVAVTSGSPVKYQWYKDGIPLGGIVDGPSAILSSYDIAVVTLADAGDYRVTATGQTNSVLSSIATLTVNPKFTGTATLSWTDPVWKADGLTPADIVGYMVRYGRLSGNYTESLRVAAVSPAVITGLAPGTWFFNIHTLDSDGNESLDSFELSKTITE